MTDHPMFALSEEYQELRASIRDICEAKIAPHAADVDANSRFPQEAYDALAATAFLAPHIPEAYGGMGAANETRRTPNGQD